MNNIIKLRPVLQSDKNPSQGGGPSLRANKSISTNDIHKKISELDYLYEFWSKNKYINGALIGVYYDSIVPKSRRVVRIFKSAGLDTNNSIVGAKFSDEKVVKHIITHFISLENLKNTISELEITGMILDSEFNGQIDNSNFNKKFNSSKYGISISNFKQIIADLSSIVKFDLVDNDLTNYDNVIVSLYDTKQNTIDLLKSVGINTNKHNMIGEKTVLLNSEELDIIKSKIPYLVSMSLNDLSKITIDDLLPIEQSVITIPDPIHEPTIGVIDTMFDERVYFSKWVKFKNTLKDDIELEAADYNHGTAVTSLIVDGPSFNPELEDGCGRFQVRHFGVATSRASSSFVITKKIEEIIKNNNDIKVWNLSLGSMNEINNNYISIEASVIDELQSKYDIIFVIAGTNKPKDILGEYKIGAPADSINSLVVNSVNKDKTKTKYSRQGIALSFYQKPDLSYYGGEYPEYINVCSPTGLGKVSGTSYAAPLIARKLSYMIDILGLSREVAKALIIDSSIEWYKNYSYEDLMYIGNGVVPIHINDVLRSKKNEIKIILEGNSKLFDTNFQNLPVPEIDGKHPYKVKGTLCYFPKTKREQGVDYTQTELDLYFGRIKPDNNIKSIDRNTQSYESSYVDEQTARENFRKWDNVKHIKDKVTDRSMSIVSYKKNWGLSIKKKHRTSVKDEDLRFGIVITLKAIDGVNRLDQFKRNCNINGIQAIELDIENTIDVHTKAEEELIFE